jgi:DNA ligase-1
VFDGELLMLDKDGKILPRTTGNGMIGKAVKGTISDKEASRVVCKLWDIVRYEDWKNEYSSTPYSDRWLTLNTCILQADSDKLMVTDNRLLKNLDEANAMFNEYLEMGEEGIILKDTKAPWENKRAKHQIKFKAEEEADLEVVAWYEGKKGSKYVGQMGGLTCKSSDGKIVVDVGGGWSDKLRKTIKKGQWEGKIIAVRYNCRVKDKNSTTESLFLPRFIEERLDKKVANSSKEIK